MESNISNKLSKKAERAWQRRKNRCKRFNKWQEHRAKKYGFDCPRLIALPYQIRTTGIVKETVNGMLKDLISPRFTVKVDGKELPLCGKITQ